MLKFCHERWVEGQLDDHDLLHISVYYLCGLYKNIFEEVHHHKILSVIHDNNLSRAPRVNALCKKKCLQGFSGYLNKYVGKFTTHDTIL